MKKVCAFVLMHVFLFSSGAIAYDSESVHPKINEEALRSSVNLKNTLAGFGYPKGVDDTFSINVNKRIFQYFCDGGKQEDVPSCRSRNHFHDPTKTFDSAGLSNAAINAWCLNWSNYSALSWAQHQSNEWSWQQARNYYYQALTATDKAVREQNFANTFRSVGQVMHLLADMSVPEHVRNDIHILPFFDNVDQSIWIFPPQTFPATYPSPISGTQRPMGDMGEHYSVLPSILTAIF